MKIIIFDLDNTVVLNNELSPYCLKILQQCHERGYTLGIATSRSMMSASKFIKLLKPDFLVASGGALVHIFQESYGTIREDFLSEKECDFIFSVLRKNHAAEFIIAETDTGYYCNNFECLTWDGFHNVTSFKINEKIQIQAYKIMIPYHEKTKVLLECDDLKQFQIKFYNNGKWIKILKAGISKLSGVQCALEALGCSVHDAIYFGDDADDIELLKACFLGIAVENASQEVKTAADMVCGCTNDDGVAKWLQAYVLD